MSEIKYYAIYSAFQKGITLDILQDIVQNRSGVIYVHERQLLTRIWPYLKHFAVPVSSFSQYSLRNVLQRSEQFL